MKKMYSKHFTEKELACPTTGEILLAEDFIEHLETLRRSVGEPMSLTSGCRSSKYNAWLKSRGYPASPHSLHLMVNDKYGTNTCAVDVARTSGPFAAKLVQTALDQGWSVGTAKTFIHLDLRSYYTSMPQTLYSYG